MEHPWFQPGDRVRVRQFDDMESEYGYNDAGSLLRVPFFFNREMKQYCGMEYVVEDACEASWAGKPCQMVYGLPSRWNWTNAMLEYAEPTPVCKIEIGTLDGLL